MRRKIVCTILLLAFVLSVLSGCILPVNTERDMKQVIATVNYKGMVAEIKKLDAVEQYYSYGSTYVNNYGMQPQEAFEYIVEQLANRKLLVLDAIDMDVDPNFSWDNKTMQLVVADSAIAIRNEAQDVVNEQLEQVFKNYVETVTEEYSKNEDDDGDDGDGDDDEEETDDRTTRPLPTVEEEEEKEYSNTELIPSWYQNFDYAEDYKDYECENANIARIAFNRLGKLLEGQYKTEEIFIQSQYEQILIQKLQEKLIADVEANLTDSDVLARFEENLLKNQTAYSADNTSYATSFTNNEVLYFHPETGYATVKHVLLSFEEANLEDRKVENTHIFFDGNFSLTEYNARKNSGNYTTEATKAYRVELAKSLRVNDYGSFNAWWNPIAEMSTEDREEATKDLIDWRDLKYDKDNIPTVKTFVEFFEQIRADVNAKTTKEEKFEVFNDYIFGYSHAGDSGMFNNAYDYTVKPEDNNYMEEFTAMCLNLISGEALPDSVNYGTYGDEVGKVGSMGWCITDYGVHLIMVTNIANAGTDANGNYTVNGVEDLKNIYIGDNDNTTMYDYIYETLKGARETSAISAYQMNLINKEGKDAVTVTQSIIDDLFKQ